LDSYASSLFNYRIQLEDYLLEETGPFQMTQHINKLAFAFNVIVCVIRI